MGYLPIVLALLGFSFLWAVVNYNSIKLKKYEAEQAAHQMFKYAGLRSTIIKRMANIVHEDETLQQIVRNVRDHLQEQEPELIPVEEKIKAEKKVSQLVNDIPADYITDSPYSEAYRQLHIAQNSYQKAVSMYYLRRQEYHELLSKYPSKLIAKAGGFKPIKK